MTTRLKGFTVILQDDIREDNSEYIINAIKMIKGVQQVLPVEQCHRDNMAESKVRMDIYREIIDFAHGLTR